MYILDRQAVVKSFVILLVTFVASSALYGEEVANNRSDAISRLRSPNSEKNIKAAATLQRQRRKILKVVNAKLTEGKEDDRLSGDVLACVSLAEALRLRGAVGPLIGILDKKSLFQTNPALRKHEEMGKYPAVDALVSIGLPAAKGCINELQYTRNPVVRKNLCYVIGSVYGKDLGLIAFEQYREKRGEVREAVEKRFDKAEAAYREVFALN